MRARHVLSIAAMVVATSGLAACGTYQEGGTATPPRTQSSAPSHSASSSAGKPVVVNLPGSSKTVQLIVGQQLTVHFSAGVSVEPSTTKCTATDTSNVVQRLCTGGGTDNLTYKAVHAGTSSMLFTIKPKCSAGAACPDWVQQAHFSVVVKS